MKGFIDGFVWRLVLAVLGLVVVVGLLIWIVTRTVHADEWRGCATNEKVAVHTRAGDCDTKSQIEVKTPEPPAKPPKEPKPPKEEEQEKPRKDKWH